jgi:hypothetical protein
MEAGDLGRSANRGFRTPESTFGKWGSDDQHYLGIETVLFCESMSSHDFKGLHDKEFEALCADLLGVSMSLRLERFKPGPDQGVDARCFDAGGGEIILQCKHRPASSIADLVRHLREKEQPKAEKLLPARYLLAVSHSLSRDLTKLLLRAPTQGAEDHEGQAIYRGENHIRAAPGRGQNARGGCVPDVDIKSGHPKVRGNLRVLNSSPTERAK